MTAQKQKLISVDWKRLGRIFAAILGVSIILGLSFLIAYYLFIVLSGLNISQVDPRLVLEYLKVLIWPLVVIIVLIFLKPHLPSLADSIEEFNLLGSSAKFRKKPSEQTSSKDNSLIKLDASADDPAPDENDEEDLSESERERILTSPEATINYYKIFIDIFRTQIEALKLLHAYSDGLKSDAFAQLLKRHQQEAGEYAFNSVFELMSFLVNNTLAIYDKDSDTYRLTNGGYYFLKFLTRENLDNKRLAW